MSADPVSPQISARMSAPDWARLLFLSMIWGSSFFLIGIAVDHLPVLTIVALRVSIAAAVLWAAVRLSGKKMPRELRKWRMFLIMGLLNNVGPFTLIVWGQTQIPSGLASILNATTPLWTVLVAAMLIPDEPPSLRKLGGVILGLGGVAVMIGLDSIAGHGMPVLPQIAVLCAAIGYAFSGAYGRNFAREHIDPIVSAAGMLTASSLILVPLALLTEGLPDAVVPATSWLAVTALGVVCTGYAYVLFFGILARAGATNISLVTFLVPVSAILLGWMFLAERLGFANAVGIAMIAGGLVLIDGRIGSRAR